MKELLSHGTKSIIHADARFAFLFGDNGIHKYTDNDGRFWFESEEIAKLLEFSTVDELENHVSDKFQAQCYIKDDKSKAIKNIISESGVYQAIIELDTSKTKIFRDWLFEVVMPCIHQTGAYIS